MSLPSSSLLKVEVHGRRTDQWLAGLALASVPLGIMIAALAAGPGTTLAWYVLCSCLIAVLCLLVLWRDGVFGGARRILGVTLLADGGWSVTDGRGAHCMRLSAGTRIGRGWLWLRWMPDSGALCSSSRWLLLTAADLPAEDLRRLQVYLRWHVSVERSLRNRRGVPAAMGGV